MPPRAPLIRRLRSFDAVARLGTMGRAAQALGLSQPALTQTLGKLDQMFAARLLDRTRAGSFLTADGLLLHRRVTRLLDTVARAIADVGGAPAAARHLTDSQLAAHIAIVEAGTFAAAARRLALSEPALHRAARTLEAALGVTLYRRAAHGVTVTAAGLLLSQQLRLALSEIDRAREEIAAARGVIGGRVAVGALPLMPKRVLARATAGLLRTHPAARIELIENAHDHLTADLRAGAIDIMVGALRDAPLAGLTQAALFADPYVYVVRPGHPLLRQPRIAPEDLATYDWIVPHTGLPRRAVVEDLFRTLSRRPRIVVETSSLSLMTAILQESDCITLLSRAQVASALAALAVDIPAPPRAVGITTRADWLPTPSQQAFLHLLRDR